MSGLDDFGVDNENEDKLGGDEEELIDTVDSDQFIDPASNDEWDQLAQTLAPELDVNNLAQGNKEIIDEE